MPVTVLRALFAEPEPDYLPDLMTVSLKEEIALAATGDKLAVRNAAAQIASIVIPYKVDPQTKRRSHYPLPDYVREYLFNVLHRIGSGDDANDAFNLNKPGPGIWTTRDEICVADFVGRLMSMGFTKGAAAAAVAEFISDPDNAFGDIENPPITPFQFGLRPIRKATAEKWHTAHAGKIATAIHVATERRRLSQLSEE